MEASPLGKSRKGSPCLKDIQPGEEVVLGAINGPGVIHHMWVTTDNKTAEGDCFVLRDLVIRIYWDEEKEPSVEVPLGDFFCCGFGKECIINSDLVTVVPSRGMNSYIQMPFKKKALVTLLFPWVKYGSIPAFPGKTSFPSFCSFIIFYPFVAPIVIPAVTHLFNAK